MKRNTIRNAFAALSISTALVAGAAQAANFDNREIGHSAPVATDTASVQSIAGGVMNSQVGHFALQAGSVDAGYAPTVYGDTTQSLR